MHIYLKYMMQYTLQKAVVCRHIHNELGVYSFTETGKHSIAITQKSLHPRSGSRVFGKLFRQPPMNGNGLPSSLFLSRSQGEA